MTSRLPRTDHQLRVAIADELEWTPSVEADRIGVSVADGAVTLSGEVLSYPEKAAAAAAVLRIHGVTAVADEIEVQHPAGSHGDADVAREAGAALDRTVVVPAASVKADVHDHVITLTGTVDWQYQREAAHHAVAGLPGVRAVRNDVALTPSVPVAAADAKAKITAALVRQARMDARNVAVAITDSAITLTGTVSSAAERHQAEHAAWSTPGVVFVRNDLTVDLDGSV